MNPDQSNSHHTELLEIHRVVWPLQDAINALIRGSSALIHEPTHLYLRDCYDHTMQTIDVIETDHELYSDLRDNYVSVVSNRMNEIMKVLSLIAMLFIPLTFIADRIRILNQMAILTTSSKTQTVDDGELQPQVSRILLVEDEVKLIESLTLGLTDEGFLVDAAKGTEDTRELLKKEKFDLIILDWMLPDGSGIELLIEMRQSGMNVPVLILSGRDSVEDRVYGLNAGADAYVTKPFHFTELIARIRGVTAPPWTNLAADLYC